MSDAEGTTGNVTDETRPISVAELLARNGKQVGATAGGRRRRGVQGGISVAELTGDIPIIRDDPPTGSIPRTHAVPEPEPEPAKVEPKKAELKKAEPKKAETKKVEPEKVAPEKAEPPKVSSLRLDDGPIGAFGRPSSLRLDDIAPQVREPEPAAEPVDRPTNRNAMAWSTDEREPQLLSGSTVAGDLMRGAHHGRDSRDEQATDPVNNFPPVSVDADEQEERDDAEQSHEPSIRRQWLVLLGQAVVAVVAGALLFKGFERLWDMMQWVAFALSILVILGLVAMVRILRKTDDILSIVIAIVVGVFVTMGPLVFLLSKS